MKAYQLLIEVDKLVVGARKGHGEKTSYLFLRKPTPGERIAYCLNFIVNRFGRDDFKELAAFAATKHQPGKIAFKLGSISYLISFGLKEFEIEEEILSPAIFLTSKNQHLREWIKKYVNREAPRNL